MLTPSQAYVLTPRLYPFILLLFQFCSGCLASYLVSEQTPIYWSITAGKNQKISTKKKKKSFPCFSSHQTTIPTQKPTNIKETRSKKPITHSTRTVPQEFINTDLTHHSKAAAHNHHKLTEGPATTTTTPSEASASHATGSTATPILHLSNLMR